ncbi:DUF3023 domain-containing protein [Ehrlichia ruminantium]|nr:DUF3023 domain-containing protein [Ehrlichia ruminantium]
MKEEKIKNIRGSTSILCDAICSTYATNDYHVLSVKCIGYTHNNRQLIVHTQCPENLLPIPQSNSLFIVCVDISPDIITNNENLSSTFELTESESKQSTINCAMYCLVNDEQLGSFTHKCNTTNNKPKLQDIIQFCSVICITLNTERISSLQISEEELINSVGIGDVTFRNFSDLRKEKLKKIQQIKNELCSAICSIYAANNYHVLSVKCIGHTPNNQQLIVHTQCPDGLLPIPQSNSLFIVKVDVSPDIITNNKKLSSTFALTESESKQSTLNCAMYCLVNDEQLESFTHKCNTTNNKPRLQDIIQFCSVICITLNTERMSSLQISEEELINSVGIGDVTFKNFSDLRKEKFKKIQQINNELCSAICISPEANKIIDVKCVGHTTTKNKLVVHTECPLALLPTPQGDSLFSILMAIPHAIIANNAILSPAFKVVKNDLGINSNYILCTAYCLVTKHDLQDFTNEVSSDDATFENLSKLCSVKCVTLHTQEILSLNISQKELINNIGLCNATFKHSSHLHQEKIDILKQVNSKLCREICNKLRKHKTQYIRCIGNTVNTKLVVTTQCPRDLLPFPKGQSLFIIRINISPNIILHSKTLRNTFKLTTSERSDHHIKCDMYCLVYEENIKSFIDVCDDPNKPYIEELIQYCSVKCIKLYTQEMLSLNISEEQLINDIGLCNAEFKYVESKQVIESVLDAFNYIEIQANKLLCGILPTLCALYKKDFLIKKIRCIGNTIDPEQGLTIYPSSIYPKEFLPTAQGTSLFLIRTRMLTEVILSTPELVNVYSLNDEEMSNKYLLCDIYCLVDEKNLKIFKNLCTKTKNLSDMIITCGVKYVRIHTKDSKRFPFDEAKVLKHLGGIDGRYLDEGDFDKLLSSGLYTKSSSKSSSTISTEEESSTQEWTPIKHSLRSRLLKIRKQIGGPESSSSATLSSGDELDSEDELQERRQKRRARLARLQHEESQTTKSKTGIGGILSDQEVSHHKSQSKDLD